MSPDPPKYNIFDSESFLSPRSGERKISIKPNNFSSYVKYPRRPKEASPDYETSIDGCLIRVNCSCCHGPLDMDSFIEKKDTCSRCLNLKHNKQNGEISNKSGSRLQLAFDWMYLLSKRKKAYNEKLKGWYNFKLNLLTIKLPCQQLHDDAFIKSTILNAFLTQMRKIYKIYFYIWRMERQNDGILHFHILCDQFLPYKDVNNIWNNVIRKHGYIDQYRTNQLNHHKNGFIYRPQYDRNHNNITGKPQKRWTKAQQIKAYKDGMAADWQHPSSTTDVHSIRQIKSTRAYLAKYIAKPTAVKEKAKDIVTNFCAERGLENLDPEKRKQAIEDVYNSEMLKGNLWYLSQSLSKLKSCIIDVDEVIVELFKQIYEHFKPRIWFADWCQIFKFSIKEIIIKNFTPLLNPLQSFITEIREKFFPQKENMFSVLGIPLNLF